MSVIRGMVLVVVAIIVIGRVADSLVLNWIVDNALAVLLIVVLLVFQPEFRRAFEHVGRAGGLRHWGSRRQPYRAMITMAATAAHRLSQQRVGGLFVFERDTGLEELAEAGVRLGAEPTTELLESIFLARFAHARRRGTAATIRGSGRCRDSCQRCRAISPPVDRTTDRSGGHLGTRHRAALQISEETDADGCRDLRGNRNHLLRGGRAALPSNECRRTGDVAVTTAPFAALGRSSGCADSG